MDDIEWLIYRADAAPAKPRTRTRLAHQAISASSPSCNGSRATSTE